MNPDERDHLLLAAYLDGELSPGETLEMERRLQIDPQLRQLRDDLTDLSGSVRQVLSETAVPPDLAESVGARFAKVSVLPQRPARKSWHSIAAALLIGLFAGGPLGFGVSHLLGSREERPVADAIFANHLRGLAAPQPFDIASSDRHTVKPWFNGRTAIAPDAPDLAAQGYPLAGGRVDIVDGTPVPTLVYRRRQHVISVTVVPRNTDNSAASIRREGSQIERWDAGDLSYFVASDLNAKELGEFGALFRSATAPAG